MTKTKGPCVVIEFCVVTKFGRAKSFLVTTECFYVATKLAMVEALYVTI